MELKKIVHFNILNILLLEVCQIDVSLLFGYSSDTWTVMMIEIHPQAAWNPQNDNNVFIFP